MRKNALTVRQDFAEYARRNDLDSDVMIEALAQVVGITAAVLDAHAGRQSFRERMDAFAEVAHQTYTTMTLVRKRTGSGP